MNTQNILDQINSINETLKPTIGRRCDYKYPFAVTDIMLDMANREKTTFGSIEGIGIYSAEQCRIMGYIPWLVVYNSFNPYNCPEEKGVHNFYIICERL